MIFGGLYVVGEELVGWLVLVVVYVVVIVD